MDFIRQIPKSFHDDLAELLTSFYDAATLRQLYVNAVAPALGEDPNQKPPVKAEIVKAILEVSKDPGRMATFVENLPEELARVIRALLWVDRMTLETFEDLTGLEIVRPNPNPRRYGSNPAYVLNEGLGLVVMWFRDRYFYREEEYSNRKNFTVALPPAVRAWLKPCFPKPEGYYFKGSERLPAEGKASWLTFTCSEQALQDMVVVADFVQRGGVRRNKNGTVARGALKKLCAATSGREMYPDVTYSPKLPFFRHEFLVDFITELLPEKHVKGLANASVDANAYLRSLPEVLAGAPVFTGTTFLPHLRADFGGYSDFHDGNEVLKNFVGVFGAMPAGKWITRKEALNFCHLRDLDGLFFVPEPFRFHASDQTDRYDLYSPSRKDIEWENVQDAVTWPLFSGLALGLAALGLVEVAYTDPYNARYHVAGHEYLSPYEGVQAVRLTELGAFAFGKTKRLEVPELESTGAKLHFAADRLHVRGEQIDAITEGALRDYMEPVGPGLFKMTRGSFLKHCQTTADVTRHIHEFRQRIPADLPPYWNDFFERIANEPPALKREDEWIVFKLPERAEIRNAFVQDPVLRSFSLKVEGWRVAVEKNVLPKVEKRLRTLGFFSK